MSQARTYARQSALQALYQWQLTGQNLNEIEQQFVQEERLKNVQRSYFVELFHGVPKQLHAIDEALAQFIDRPIEQIDPVERAILRLSVYELINRLDVPYRVILNEGISLAKRFGAEESHKYINGILDKVAQQCRSIEINARKKNK